MKLPTFKLEKYFDRHEFHAPYILCGSDNEPLKMRELLAMADEESLELWESLSLGYTPVPGAPLLRKEIAKLYQNIGEREIGTFAGAEEAIFAAMSVIVRPGDHVIVPTPCYQSLSTLPKELGAEVSLLPLKERSGGWVFEVEDLIKLVTPKTRLIVINFPHNPTGVHIDRKTLERIVECAKSTGAYLLSDEVYRFSEHRSPTSLIAAADLYEKAISLGVMSKTFGLAGLRIGWLATKDSELLEECLDYKFYLSICNSGPSEILALMALRAKERILERNLNIIRRNLELLDRFFEKYPKLFAWKRPTAGSTAFPKLLAQMPIREFTDDLVSREGVMLLPGSVYEISGNYFRLGFGRKDMPEALNRLERYVKHRFQDRSDY
ncbi:MAG: aminotransferase class I/II-fold pyridoxal phosphate-dependent enzyme [Chlamydiales bacterium]|nr:aminotransferase class I/II-fold pyridoxal phosphate-dependent enzyme [Chlamydiales bacterium]